MNGIEKITARIEQDARTEIEALLKETEEKAAAIRAEYEARAAAQADKAAQSSKQAAAQRLERLEGAAEMAVIDKTFAKAKETLLSMSEEDYVELLAKLAVRSSKTGREEIILNERDRETVGYKVVSRANALLAEAAAPELPDGANALLQGTAMLTLADESREMDGGLILRDGKVEINCAFEAQLRVLRETMAADVAKVLFP